MNMKTDARVRYTKMMIHNVFIDLLKEKPVTKISVTEICKRAEINRTTFYKHYLDVYDLLEQIEKETAEQLKHMLDSQNIGSARQILLYILDALKNHRELFFALAENGMDKSFLSRLALICYQYYLPDKASALSTLGEDDERFVQYCFIVGGINSIIEYWMRTDMKRSPDELADSIEHLLALHL